MVIAKVVGNVWATCKHPGLEGYKLLLIRNLEVVSGKLYGKIQMAVDGKFNAGPGDTVLVLDEGSSARQILDNPNAPVRTVIAGIIDQAAVGEKVAKYT